MTQRLRFLASFDIVIPKTWPFPEREKDCEKGIVESEFDDQAYKQHTLLPTVIHWKKKPKHMAPNQLQGIMENTLFLCPQEKEIKFINNLASLYHKEKINLHNDKTLRFPSITSKSSSTLYSRIHLYVYFLSLMKKSHERLVQKKGLYY